MWWVIYLPLLLGDAIFFVTFNPLIVLLLVISLCAVEVGDIIQCHLEAVWILPIRYIVHVFPLPAAVGWGVCKHVLLQLLEDLGCIIQYLGGIPPLSGDVLQHELDTRFLQDKVGDQVCRSFTVVILKQYHQSCRAATTGSVFSFCSLLARSAACGDRVVVLFDSGLPRLYVDTCDPGDGLLHVLELVVINVLGVGNQELRELLDEPVQASLPDSSADCEE